MSRVRIIVAALFCMSVVAIAQDDKKMPSFQPTKEHQALKQFDGEWEFTSKCTMPGQEAMEGKGTESVRMTYGGFWADIESKGVMAGKDWSGRGLVGWDPLKKKYCGVWVDSMTPYLYKFLGESDATGKTWTFKTHGVDPKTNKESTEKMVWEFKDQDHRTMKFYTKDESGKEIMVSECTYTRKPAMVK
jgi:hypothetical protein